MYMFSAFYIKTYNKNRRQQAKEVTGTDAKSTGEMMHCKASLANGNGFSNGGMKSYYDDMNNNEAPATESICEKLKANGHFAPDKAKLH